MLRTTILAVALLSATMAHGEDGHSSMAPPNLQEVDVAVEKLLEEAMMPGVAVAVLQDGLPVHIGTYGLASIENSVPVKQETVFELASLTKQMTSLAVLHLAEEGQIALDDPISKYLEETPPQWSAITIDQLMSHTAGLEHRFEEMPRGSFMLDYDTDGMLEMAKATPMVSEPGTDWHYSDQGYFLLGMVIEKVSGKTFGQFMQDRFFAPFDMTQTHMLDQSSIVPHLAQGYVVEDDELKRGRRVWQFELAPHFGVRSSLRDMIRWEQGLLSAEGDLAQALAAADDIQRPFTNGESCEAWGYARGWWVTELSNRRFVDHAGYSGTAYVRDMTNGRAVVVLTNREQNEALISPSQVAWTALNAIDPTVPSSGFKCWE